MGKDNIELIEKLNNTKHLDKEEWTALFKSYDKEDRVYAAEAAKKISLEKYGKKIFIRGIVEFSNICKNDCYYCGIRRDNTNAQRYRLSEEEIVACSDMGYDLGFRTFVLQGGEDPYFTDERIVSIVKKIKEHHPDTAVTLSIGERERESFQRFFDAGADRYLLRHETADKSHYAMLHPSDMSYEHRMKCLRDLHEIGFQTGCGMMVGSPGQTIDNLICDLRFIQRFKPEMVGIGPFIPHHDTKYADHKPGSVGMTLRLLSVIRLMLPEVLLPATTALGTLDPNGREKGLMAGANVVMPNLSPVSVRKKYQLYDNKICTGDEAAECIRCMSERIERTGYRIKTDRGDHVRYREGFENDRK